MRDPFQPWRVPNIPVGLAGREFCVLSRIRHLPFLSTRAREQLFYPRILYLRPCSESLRFRFGLFLKEPLLWDGILGVANLLTTATENEVERLHLRIQRSQAFDSAPREDRAYGSVLGGASSLACDLYSKMKTQHALSIATTKR